MPHLRAALAALLLLTPLPAAAQEWLLTSYVADIGP